MNKRFEWDINNHAPSEVQMCITDAGPWIRNEILPIALQHALEEVATIFCDVSSLWSQFRQQINQRGAKIPDCAIVEENSDLTYIDVSPVRDKPAPCRSN